jgi:hypothetical protein
MGNSLGTAMSPTKPRGPHIVLVPDADSVGAGYYDEEGEFQLWDAGELPDFGVCTS